MLLLAVGVFETLFSMKRPAVSNSDPSSAAPGAAVRNRPRQIFTAALRGKILRSLHDSGRWSGSRKGVQMRFLRVTQGQLFTDTATVEYAARIGAEWTKGKAGTVWDACQQIESL